MTKDVPEAVKNPKEDILSVDMALSSLQALEDQELQSFGEPWPMNQNGN